MKKIPALFFVVLFLLFFYSINLAYADIAKDEAIAIVINNVLKNKTEGINIYVTKALVPANATIECFKNKYKLSKNGCWLFFVDNYPLADWGHHVQIIYIDYKTGKYNMIEELFPPKLQYNDFGLEFEIVSETVDVKKLNKKIKSEKPKFLLNFLNKQYLPGSYDQKNDTFLYDLNFKNNVLVEQNTGVKEIVPNNSNPSHNTNYAVLISGGAYELINNIRYYYDLTYIYRLLLANGYAAENIFVFCAGGVDGSGNIIGQFNEGTYTAPDLHTKKADLNGDTIPDVDYAATGADIKFVFDNILGPSLGSDDLLFVFTGDHGGNSIPPGQDNGSLALWYETMTEGDFAAQLDKISVDTPQIILMRQCFSGTFLEGTINIKRNNRIVSTASNWNEYAWSFYEYGFFSYYWMSAVNKSYPFSPLPYGIGGPNPLSADLNCDTFISIKEAHTFAATNDPANETPQYYESSPGLGNMFSLAGLISSFPTPMPTPIITPLPKPTETSCLHRDATFNEDGIVTFSNASGDQYNYDYDMMIDSNGKILVVGSSVSCPPAVFRMTIWRYNPDGSPDLTFGGTGYVRDNNASGAGMAVAIDNNGKILVTGRRSVNGMTIWRYNPDGSPDLTFAGTGYVSAGFVEGTDIVIDRNNKILVGGIGWGMNATYAAWRYNPDGSPDLTFAGTGYVTYDTIYNDLCWALTTDHNGKILLAGYQGIIRYNENGSFDLAFAQWGDFTSIAIDNNNKILATGFYNITKYNENGTLDLSFGGTGMVELDSAGKSIRRAFDIILDKDGKILVTGETGDPTNWPETYDMVIWRYNNSNGTLDTVFNLPLGYVRHNNAAGGNTEDFGKSIIVDDSNRILVAGHSWNGTSYSMTIWRYIDKCVGPGTPVPTDIPTPSIPCNIIGTNGILRVNCGKTDADIVVGGEVWIKDQPYAGAGSWGYVGATYVDGHWFNTPLYNYELRGGGSFEYKFDIPNGTYQVYLHFVEPTYGTPGYRIFNVYIEDYYNPVLSNFDIFTAAGNQLWTDPNLPPFTAYVLDGQLNIKFEIPQGRQIGALIGAIKIVCAGYPVTPTPTPPAYTIKDKAIDWLHTMQILNPTDSSFYGAWGLNNNIEYVTSNSDLDETKSNIGVTALTILSLLNEGRYNYCTIVPPLGNIGCSPVTGFAINDPTITLGIQYILDNVRLRHPSVPQDKVISDWEGAYPPYAVDTYDTALACVVLSAYRRVARVTDNPAGTGNKIWDDFTPAFRQEIEDAMHGGYNFLMNAQAIELKLGGSYSTDLPNFRVADHNGHGDVFNSANCNYGGWGYPRANWTDMSNTQFAMWALEVMDTETRETDDGIMSTHDTMAEALGGPGGTELVFYTERRDKAYIFILNSNENPLLYPPGNPQEQSAGGRYGSCTEQWTVHTRTPPFVYGSMTAAGVWSIYCANKLWDPNFPFSDPVAANEVTWLSNPYGNGLEYTNNPGLGMQFYHYYIMTLMKGFLMQTVPENIVPGGWYTLIKNHLHNVVSGPTTHSPWLGDLNYWKYEGISAQSDVFATVCAILGIETKMTLPTYQYGIPSSKLYVQLLSPAEILVIDEDGKQTGCENGIQYYQIPGSTFTGCGTEPQSISVNSPNGAYRIKVNATDTGTITLKAWTEVYGNKMSEYSKQISVSSGEGYEYRIAVGNVLWPATITGDFIRKDYIPPVITPTYTTTFVPTPTSTVTSTVTSTLTPTATPTGTSTNTATPTSTPTFTPTYTATPTPTPTNTIESGVSYKLEYRAAEDTRIDLSNIINPTINFQNDGDHAIDLNRLVVRYYYSADGYGGDENIQIDWAREKPGRDDITDKVIVNIVKLPGNCQDRILEISFASDAGKLKKNGKIELGIRITRADGNKYNQSNDYSFGDQNGWKWWDKIVVSVGGYIVWGTEPPVCVFTSTPAASSTPTMIYTEITIAEKMSEKNTYNYPNPAKDKTTIRFSLSEPKEVSIVLYTVSGQLVWQKNLNSTETQRGINNIEWCLINDLGSSVANGIYLLKVITEDKIITKKVAVIR